MTPRFGKAALPAAFAIVLAALPGFGYSQTREAATEPATVGAATPMNAADLAASVVHHGDGVAAIVNDSVISDYDLRQRIALFIATSGVRPTGDALNAIRDQ
ncbi:MAG: hypothetical protein ACREHV_17230, partial [Rhizomicrobium sp.]